MRIRLSSKNRTEDAIKAGLKIRGNKEAINWIEKQMNTFRKVCHIPKDLTKGLKIAYLGQLYRECYEASTGKINIVEQFIQIEKMNEKYKNFI